MAHPAPPYYRSLKPGKPRHRVTLAAPAEGRHQANASVPPIVHTDMIGNRVLFVNRSVRIGAQKIVLD